uniref:Uncharacterized protein n=2 Tax=Anopheles melas TaxID=34690 RepID=A0A182UFC6_9DIPT
MQVIELCGPLIQLVLASASSYQWAPVSWMEQNRKPARRSGVDACGTVSVRTCCPSSNVDGPGPVQCATTVRITTRIETLDGAKAKKPADDDDDDDGGDGGDSDDGPGEEEEEGEVRDEVGQDESKQLLRHAAGSALAPHPAVPHAPRSSSSSNATRDGPGRKATARLFRCCLPCRGDGGGGGSGGGGGGGGRGASARSSGSGASGETLKDTEQGALRSGTGRGRDRGDGVGRGERGRRGGGGGGGRSVEESIGCGSGTGRAGGTPESAAGVGDSGGGTNTPGDAVAMATVVSGDGKQTTGSLTTTSITTTTTTTTTTILTGNGRPRNSTRGVLQASLAKQEEDDDEEADTDTEMQGQQEESDAGVPPKEMVGPEPGTVQPQHPYAIGLLAGGAGLMGGSGRPGAHQRPAGRHRGTSAQQHPQSLPHIREERKRNGSADATVRREADDEADTSGSMMEEEEEEEEDEEEEEARAGESLEVGRKEPADEEERDDDEQEEIDDGYSADEDDSARRVLAVPLIPTVAGAGKYQQAGKPQQQLPPPHPKYHRNRRHTLANVR